MASEWKDFKSAPKDGTRIIALSPVDGILTTHWENGLWQSSAPWRGSKEERARAGFTLWQDLPGLPGTKTPYERGYLRGTSKGRRLERRKLKQDAEEARVIDRPWLDCWLEGRSERKQSTEEVS